MTFFEAKNWILVYTEIISEASNPKEDYILYNQNYMNRVLHVMMIEVGKLQSVSWILAEFCYNRSPQGPYTGTCTILQETINGFICPLIVFRKM